MATKTQIIAALKKNGPDGRSHWAKAVYDDALDLAKENLRTGKQYTLKNYESDLLNGARNWKEYSWGGLALVYNHDIAKWYCTPSEFKKTKQGMNPPNSREEWLDVQARALYQAARLISKAISTTIARRVA